MRANAIKSQFTELWTHEIMLNLFFKDMEIKITRKYVFLPDWGEN